jgi:hypothetical protein
MAFRAHARVHQDLHDSITRRGRLLLLIGPSQRFDEVDWVVVGDELQRVSNALDKIVLLDDGHDRLVGKKED